MSDGFYTIKGYQAKDSTELTSAMEDYLEMICRIVRVGHDVRIRDLSEMLHVKPSSASKMIQNLNALGYVSAEKYGVIHITEKGRVAGDYLLYRHEVISRFLCRLNNSNDETEQAEKIEHFLTPTTVRNLDKLYKKGF